MSRGGGAGPRRAAAAAGALAVALAVAATGCGREPAPEADLILLNARLAPSDAGAAMRGDGAGAGSAGRAEASIALAGGRILAIGDRAAVDRHRGERTGDADLGGALVVPGIEDALARPLESGERRLNEAGGRTIFLDLSAAETEEDAVQRVRQRARALGPGVWILGSGWDERRWVVARPPDARLLSDIVQYNPVFLVRRGGASAWVNRAALDAAGLGAIPVPVAGKERIAILRRAPALTADERRAAIEAALARSVAAGMVAVRAVASTGRLGLEDCAAPPAAVLDPWRDLARRGRLPVRVALLVPAPSAAAEALVAGGPESYPGGGRLEIRTLLLDATGTGAATEESAAAGKGADPACGAPAGDGAAWARRGAAAGFDIAVTARDAAAVDTALEWLAGARRARAGTGARLVLGAAVGSADLAVDALAGAGVEIVIEAGPAEVTAAAALAGGLRRAGIAVAAGTGADGPLPAALRRFAAGPWTSTLAAGGPADFLVLPGDAASFSSDPDRVSPLAPLAVRVGGVEVYRGGSASRPPG